MTNDGDWQERHRVRINSVKKVKRPNPDSDRHFGKL